MSLHRWLVGLAHVAVYKAPTCRMQRNEALLRRQTKKLHVSWRSVARRESGYEATTTITLQKHVPRLQSMPARAETKRLSRSTLWNSAILFQKAP